LLPQKWITFHLLSIEPRSFLRPGVTSLVAGAGARRRTHVKEKGKARLHKQIAHRLPAGSGVLGAVPGYASATAGGKKKVDMEAGILPPGGAWCDGDVQRRRATPRDEHGAGALAAHQLLGRAKRLWQIS
jgi:hypothetical protein